LASGTRSVLAACSPVPQGSSHPISASSRSSGHREFPGLMESGSGKVIEWSQVYALPRERGAFRITHRTHLAGRASVVQWLVGRLSLKRFDLFKRPSGLRSLPIVKEFLLTKSGPLDYKSYHAWRQATGKDRQVAYIDQGPAISVFRMKMGRIMVLEEHLYHYAKKPTDLRHGPTRVSIRGRRPLAPFLSP